MEIIRGMQGPVMICMAADGQLMQCATVSAAMLMTVSQFSRNIQGLPTN